MSHGYGECLWSGCYADSGEAWGYCKKHRALGEAAKAKAREEEEALQRVRDAAPELLAALERVNNERDWECWSYPPCGVCAWCEVQAAIANARGSHE